MTKTPTPELDPQIRVFLQEGHATAKQIANFTGRSESRVREILKQHIHEIHCEKNEAGVNVFSLPPSPAPADQDDDDDFDPNEAQPTEAEINDLAAEEAYARENTCPLCDGLSPKTPAGPEGEFLGGCRICPDCGKTYNAATGKELPIAPETGAKKKRTPLNPQYKINAKIDAVTKAGGTLTFDRNTRKWVLDLNGTTAEYTAAQFATETPESIVA